MKIIPWLLLILICSISAMSQNDSLVIKNGNVIIGEIKSMNSGVIQIETDYSDSDFKIEWDQIYAVKTTNLFFSTLTDESKYYGTLESSAGSKVSIFSGDEKAAEFDLNQIVNLRQHPGK